MDAGPAPGSGAEGSSWSGCMEGDSLRCDTVSAEVTTRPAGDSTLGASISGEGPNVTLVHGFAQNRDCLGPLAQSLSARCRLVRPDAPGHGASLQHGEAAMERGAQLLIATGGRSTLVGYSMGGRLCLTAALGEPDDVDALVLIGATPGISDPVQRADRHDADLALADRLERIGLQAFIEEWLALPMFAGLPEWARFDAERRTNTAAGLAASLRHAGTGSMTPLWDRLGELSMPVLWITGADDERYGQIAARAVRAIGSNAPSRGDRRRRACSAPRAC